jgi:hypothetical protein
MGATRAPAGSFRSFGHPEFGRLDPQLIAGARGGLERVVRGLQVPALRRLLARGQRKRRTVRPR